MQRPVLEAFAQGNRIQRSGCGTLTKMRHSAGIFGNKKVQVPAQKKKGGNFCDKAFHYNEQRIHRWGSHVTFYNSVETAKAVEREAEETFPAGALLAFCSEPRTRQEIAAFLGMKTVFYAMQHYVQPLLSTGKLAMTIPEKPKSRN